jgi:NADH-quinone oxidoreductase subunit L
MILLVFYGPQKAHAKANIGHAIRISLIALCLLSITGGYVNTPPNFGGVPVLSNFLNSALPSLQELHSRPITEPITALYAGAMFAFGLGFAYLFFGSRRVRFPTQNALEQLWLEGWGFDRLYDRAFVRPFQWLTRKGAGDFADLPINGLARWVVRISNLLRQTQTGHLRWYATGLVMGTIVILAIAFFVR